ncbi:c-type cytochrome domain-containing protein [Stieleria varia]|uniref:Planctomycete cytochrome C n=1 Tax=Stieleria varia TaxID=2528005 RepID=A0A5C6AL60_9BACT|nr:c-type cytochrome domain-containing protein [Stieleria varia]TWU00765.1 Planctomycete cytochrome C [Stieleria varia]
MYTRSHLLAFHRVLLPAVMAMTLFLSFVALVSAQEVRSPRDPDGRMVNFERDIVPIFQKHCLECHGPKEAKSDFRIDELDTVMAYVEPGDVESSAMFVEYMTTDDPDLMMPPPSKGGPLSAAELSLVHLWIAEGANWPEGVIVGEPGVEGHEAVVEPKPEVARSVVGRLWGFQGYFHPAAVHFPIALLSLGGLFVIVGLKWPTLGTQIPLACLLLGAPAAIGATLMGLSFATEQGYGSWTKVDFDSEVFWHRWSGVIVAVLATVFAVIALMSLKKKNDGLTRVWKIGLVVLAGMIGAVGHQGGELSYGKDFYTRAFNVLTGGSSEEKVPPTEADTSEADATEADTTVDPDAVPSGDA